MTENERGGLKFKSVLENRDMNRENDSKDRLFEI